MRLCELKYLDLSKNGIGDRGMNVAESFQDGGESVLPELQELSLSNSPLKAVSLRYLANTISSGRLNSLKRLDMSHNRILDKGSLEAVAELVRIVF